MLWLLLIVGGTVAGTLAGTKTLASGASGVGESQRASARLTVAGLQPPAVESVLVRSGDPVRTRAAVAALESRVRHLRDVLAVLGPADSPALVVSGGRTALVQVQLRGDPTKAEDHVGAVTAAVGAVARSWPGVTLQHAGGGSVGSAITQIVTHDLRHSQIITLPVTLVILALAFGALIAASVPLLLGLTSVAAAIGALGLVSQIVAERDGNRFSRRRDWSRGRCRLLAVLHPPRA